MSDTTTWSSTLASIRSSAGAEKIGCVAQAMTRAAPPAFTASAPAQSVPAVSIMSSEMIATRPLTFSAPMTSITSATPWLGRSFEMIASDASSISANFFASFVRPASADTTHDLVAGDALVAEVLREHRQRRHVVDRSVEEALHLARVEVHRQHAVDAGRVQQRRHEARA